jgi:hypothetical protein
MPEGKIIPKRDTCANNFDTKTLQSLWWLHFSVLVIKAMLLAQSHNQKQQQKNTTIQMVQLHLFCL